MRAEHFELEEGITYGRLGMARKRYRCLHCAAQGGVVETICFDHQWLVHGGPTDTLLEMMRTHLAYCHNVQLDDCDWVVG